jgi:hypothetical protein
MKTITTQETVTNEWQDSNKGTVLRKVGQPFLRGATNKHSFVSVFANPDRRYYNRTRADFSVPSVCSFPGERSSTPASVIHNGVTPTLTNLCLPRHDNRIATQQTKHACSRRHIRNETAYTNTLALWLRHLHLISVLWAGTGYYFRPLTFSLSS